MNRRERLRESTLEEIKTIAGQQMAEQGTAAISLNAIARQMGMTTPALYRYFSSRDELITALIVDAYNAQASALETADASFSLPDDYAGRLLSVLLVYRRWALENPVAFSLIYGSPIPGYHAPAERTAPAARRNFAVILGILNAAYQAGVLRPTERYFQLPPALLDRPDAQQLLSDGLPVPVLYLGLVGWSRIHGLIMLELFHHLDTLVGDLKTFYKGEVLELLAANGLVPPDRNS
jgi:AcrR family transcriptional regulator